MSTYNPYFGKKLFIRLDGKGNAIAGTSLWLKKKPAYGKWKEMIAPNECCNTTTTTTTTTTTLG